MQKDRIDIISMGCSKNLIDSERLMKRLENKGYTTHIDSAEPEGEYVVVNTCGFIGDAKEESINMILELTTLKASKKLGKIVVMGCLSERYLEELKNAIPEVDIWYGKFDWKGFVDTLPSLKQNPDEIKDWERHLTTPSWSAYLKVSEGCDRFCAFCAIPHITGRHISRPIEEILEEVETLVSRGVKEFNVIAQDLSSYGKDLYNAQKLPELIDKIAEIPGVEWIRLHYLYPSDFPLELLDVINKHENVCNYLDIALQHISDRVLSNMKRGINREETQALLKSIREKVPGIAIRTTLMVGFPGEKDSDYEELLDFVSEQRFERMGAFAYSEEESTTASKLYADEIEPDEKEERLRDLMHLQETISEENNSALIGRKMKVLIERLEGTNGVGRTEYDSPEVDQEVIIENCKATPGEFITAEITNATAYELYAVQITND